MQRSIDKRDAPSTGPDDSGESSVELNRAEERQIEESRRPNATVLHETIRKEGDEELKRPASALFWSGVAAGMTMGVSLVAMGVFGAALPDARWARLIVSLGYSFGFVVVIMGRQQLFTENTLTPMLSLLERRDLGTLGRVAKLWGVVLVANILGGVAIAGALARTRILSPEVKAQCLAIGHDALAGSFGDHFGRAIVAGWIVALLVWVLPGAGSSRAFLIVAFTYLIGAAHLSHVVAGSCEIAYVAWTGGIPWGYALRDVVVPTLLGNVVGGTALVAALARAQVTAGAPDAHARHLGRNR